MHELLVFVMSLLLTKAAFNYWGLENIQSFIKRNLEDWKRCMGNAGVWRIACMRS